MKLLTKVLLVRLVEALGDQRADSYFKEYPKKKRCKHDDVFISIHLNFFLYRQILTISADAKQS